MNEVEKFLARQGVTLGKRIRLTRIEDSRDLGYGEYVGLVTLTEAYAKIMGDDINENGELSHEAIIGYFLEKAEQRGPVIPKFILDSGETIYGMLECMWEVVQEPRKQPRKK